MGIVSSVTDEEDDLPSGQHTMCFNTNMWTSEGSTQPNRKPEFINFNQFFSGIHLTSTRHLVCFYHVVTPFIGVVNNRKNQRKNLESPEYKMQFRQSLHLFLLLASDRGSSWCWVVDWCLFDHHVLPLERTF